MINQQVKADVANNDKMAKCWCGTGKVGVATATPAIHAYANSADVSVTDICSALSCWCCAKNVPSLSDRYAAR